MCLLPMGKKKAKRIEIGIKIKSRKYLIYKVYRLFIYLFVSCVFHHVYHILFALQTEQANDKLQSKLEQLQHHAA